MDTSETTQRIGTGLSYYHDNPDDKHYFGGFFNLAQNNIKHVIQEFCTRLHLPFKENKLFEPINNFFSDTQSYSDWERGIEVLKEYFPVVKYMDLPVTHPKFENLNIEERERKKRKYFHDNFRLLLNAINDLRNFYTHCYHTPISVSGEVFEFLDTALLEVCLKVKKNKMKDDKTRQLLKKGIRDELEKLTKLKIEELKKKKTKLELEELKKEPSKRKKIRIEINNKEAILNAVYNDSFSHLIYKEGTSHELKDRMSSKCPLEKQTEMLMPFSRSGIVFLLSLFLSKKEVEQLKSNIEGFKGKVFGPDDEVSKNKNSLKFMATQWAFSYLAFKGLKQRVKNSFDKETLLMQMIDELSKVPDEIYRNLSEKNRNEFLEDMNEYIQERDGDDQSLQNSTVIHPVIRKRYENKFNYFVMRYLDEFANFPTLKFQVYSGNYLHDNRTKAIAGSQFTTDRMIKERITVFGKLSEVSKYKSDYFSDEPKETSWELFPNPSYNLVGNNIPIFIDLLKHGEEAKNVQVEINRLRSKTNPKKKRGKRKSKEEIIAMIYDKNKNLAMGEPTALLSSNELPALLYELLINIKSGEELEKIVVDKIVDRYHAIEQYQPGQSFPHSVMSKKLLKSQSNQQRYDLEKLLRAIETEIERTDEKLTLIENNRKETQELNEYKKPKRKFIFFTNELGQEATWLAYDLKRFMPEAARKEWKGNQHSELQRFLAFYDRNKQEAIALLTQNWNLSASPVWGSEINKAFQRNTTFDGFYKNYLINRKNTLSGFMNAVSGFRDEPKFLKKVLKEVFIVFDKRLYTINSTEQQKAELLSKPINFPRGVFEEKPTFIRGQKVETAPELYANWYRYCYENEDQLQSFYQMEREYKTYFEQFGKDEKEFQLNKNKLNASEKFDLFKKKQDYTIKKIKQQDLFVKLMVDDLFEQIFNQKIELPLNDFYQTKEEREKNRLIAEAQNKREKGDDTDNRFNENFIWNKTVPIALMGGRVLEPKVKIKDVGKFRKLENDERVHQILEYDPERTWNKMELENELENRADSYERIRREQLLKRFQEFEKQILEQKGFDGQAHLKDLELDGNPNFRMYVLNGILKNILSMTELEGFELLKNGFHDIEPGSLKNKPPMLQKAYLLILIRNKFLHNQLPVKEAYDLMLEHCQKEKDKTYSQYFLDISNQIISELKA